MVQRIVQAYLDTVGIPPRVPVSQFDTGWQFIFQLYLNGQRWTIPEGATAVLNGRKPDNNVFAFSGTVADNQVTVDCDVQMTAVAGNTLCELSILSNGQVLGSRNFILEVEAAPKSPDDVSSESTLPVYEQMLEDLAKIPYDVDESVQEWLDEQTITGTSIVMYVAGDTLFIETDVQDAEEVSF